MSPLGARALLGLPAGELASIDLHAVDVLGPLAGELHERLAAAPDWPSRFVLLDRYLGARLDERAGRRQRGVSRLAAVAGQPRNRARSPRWPARSGWSERHLAAQFRTEIGLPPKAAARVIRFDRARRLIRSAPGADVAARCGYFDQSHLVRDFVAFTGLSPTAWLAAEVGNIQVPPARRSSRIGSMTDAPPPQVWPTLRATDALALIRFLVDVVGFEETVVYADGDVVHHAQLSWPLGGGIMLGSVRDDGDRWPIQPGTFGAYVVVDDPDALLDRVRAGGAEITDELHETDYGSRDFAIRDPEGNRWSFGTYRGEPRNA